MLFTYFKLAYRNLLKHKLSSFINLTGLSLAIACSLVFFLLLDKEYTSDRFHENCDRIFMVGYTLEGAEKYESWGDSPLPLGPALAAEFTQIEQAVRILDKSVKIRADKNIFTESIRFVDSSFLKMFTYPLLQGRPSILSEKNSLILSREMAEKYFGEEEPLGKRITLIFSATQQESYLVRGVAEKFPFNASFSFNVLASIEKLESLGMINPDDWEKYVQATFILVQNPEDIAAISVQTAQYIKRHNFANSDRPLASLVFEPLATLSWESQEIERSISSGSTPQALILLLVIGLFLLLQACFNYVNISLGASAGRLKEIGIRKVVGCHRKQLMSQFLGENLLLCFFALLGGLLITEFVFLPGLAGIMEGSDKLSLLELWHRPQLWLFLLLLLLTTGIGAGAYPAIILSRLQAINIFNKKSEIGGKKRFTNALLVVQFGVAFVIICLMTAFLQNNHYQRQRDWGYQPEHIININLENSGQYQILRNAVKLYPNVVQVSGAKHLLGRTHTQSVLEFNAEKQEFIRFDIGPKYLETLGIRLKQGRFFRHDLSTDSESAILINESFVQKMGWAEAVDKVIRFDEGLYTIIGVVEDFHYDFFFEEIKPVFFRQRPEEQNIYLSARIKAGSGVRSMADFENAWKSLFPDSVFNAFFQDSVFEQGFRNNNTITKIFSLTAVLTLFISCMGLLGLVTLMIAQRKKELSLHKILGATVGQISRLLYKKYTLLLTAALFLAVPFSYFLLLNLMDAIYPYHIPLDLFPFAAAAAAVLFTAFLTLTSQVYQAAVKDPIEALKYE